ncbi:MAG: hypothetical protein EKK57_05010 [Proteobacteria bacterium]|nr:MAG: hypothetical protein EKK57_05010 [Pseudomonadota bacterium]
MNIFAVNPDPEKAARELANRHISRMPLETAGMLVFAFPEGSTPIPNLRSNRHFSHPASHWCRQSKENYEWLLMHGLAQADEYKIRYKREHDSEKHINWCVNNYHTIDFPSSKFTPFARCFSSYKTLLDTTIADPILAYQEFYKLDKISFARWPAAEKIPVWWISQDQNWVDKNFKNGQYIKR